MSGFEIAGVVLGVLPLVPEALKMYIDGVKKISGMIYYEVIFDEILAKISGVGWAFRQGCEMLLGSISTGISDTEYHDLLENHKGWDSPKIRDALRIQIGERDFQACQTAAFGIRRDLSRLGEKLGLTPEWTAPFSIDGKVDKDARNKFFKKWVKIKGGFQAEEHLGIVESIRSEVNTFRESIKTSQQIHEQREAFSSRTTRTPQSWITTRNHCKGFYESLKSILPCTCASHRHLAQMRFKAPEHKQPGYVACEAITCSFTLDCENDQAQALPWQYRHTRLVPVTDTRGEITQTGSDIPIIRIHSAESDENLKNNCSSLLQIQDLCAILEASENETTCRGFLTHDQLTCHYHIHNDYCPVSSRIQVADTISLREKLTSFQGTKNKRRIALLLASAVLQLHGTQWLRRSWTLDDVFIQGNDELYISGLGLLEHSPTAPTSANTINTDILRNETLFALGLALLELNFQEVLADGPTKLQSAVQMAKKLRQTELPRFADAVANCIMQQSPTKLDFDLEQESFLDWYYQQIVLPLKEDYEEFLQERPSSSPSQRQSLNGRQRQKQTPEQMPKWSKITSVQTSRQEPPSMSRQISDSSSSTGPSSATIVPQVISQNSWDSGSTSTPSVEQRDPEDKPDPSPTTSPNREHIAKEPDAGSRPDTLERPSFLRRLKKLGSSNDTYRQTKQRSDTRSRRTSIRQAFESITLRTSKEVQPSNGRRQQQ